MPEISNPQVVKHANEYSRVFANRLSALGEFAAAARANYDAGDLGTAINDAGAGNLIADGSATDGRNRVTGGSQFNLSTMESQLLAFLDGEALDAVPGGRRGVLAQWRTEQPGA